MNANSFTTKKRSWAMILFGLPFAAVGIGFLVLSIIPMIYDWSRMSSWEPVEAELVQAKLVSNRGDDSTTYNATATYRYRFAGQNYQSSRVAINSSSDNIGDFQQVLGYRLTQAFTNHRTISVWVNPENPQEAIVDRSLRMGMMLFNIVFVVVFGGAGIGLIIWGWRTPSHSTIPNKNTKAPWLSQPSWATNNIRSQQNIAVWVSWIFASFWNAIAFPVAISTFSNTAKIHATSYLSLLFPLAGIGLVYWAIKTTLDWRRYGDPHLVLDPFPGAIGGHFGAHIDLPIPYSTKHKFKLTLNCLLIEPNSGSDNETREHLIWQTEGMATVKSTGSGCRLSFLFEIPSGLPSSEPETGNQYHRWNLTIESLLLSPSFSRSYVVPVYATAATSRQLHTPAESHPALQEEREALIESICDIEQIPGGIRLYLPYGRNAATKLMGLLFGVVFAGFGGFAGVQDAPFMFPLIFCGVGGSIALYSLYSLINCIEVHIDQRGLNYERRVLGVSVSRLFSSRNEIKQLVRKESYSTQSGNKHQKVYRIEALLTNGKAITISDSLKGRALADQMLESLSLLTGYPAK